MMRTLGAATAIVFGFAMATLARGAEPTSAKNLQLLPKTISMKELKEKMKAQAKMLGVQCDHCHDIDDFAKDTETKKTGRLMMKMTAEINREFLKGKDMVTCATCHNGHEYPPMGGPDLEKAKAAAKK
ncbi:MAG TPA: c-type cytochrome [Polyangia bacterium]|nr:c-type cytochrome [Polyangia bacterium]